MNYNLINNFKTRSNLSDLDKIVKNKFNGDYDKAIRAMLGSLNQGRNTNDNHQIIFYLLVLTTSLKNKIKNNPSFNLLKDFINKPENQHKKIGVLKQEFIEQGETDLISQLKKHGKHKKISINEIIKSFENEKFISGLIDGNPDPTPQELLSLYNRLNKKSFNDKLLNSYTSNLISKRDLTN